MFCSSDLHPQVRLKHLNHQFTSSTAARGDSEYAGCRVAAFVRAAESQAVRRARGTLALRAPNGFRRDPANVACRCRTLRRYPTRQSVTRARTQMHCTPGRPRLPTRPAHAADAVGGRVATGPLPPAGRGHGAGRADASALRLYGRARGKRSHVGCRLVDSTALPHLLTSIRVIRACAVNFHVVNWARMAIAWPHWR